MTRQIIIFLTLCFVQPLKAQNAGFVWANQFGGGGWDRSWSVATDADGNVYLTGEFQATVDFDPGPGITNLSATGTSEMFIVKMDPTGGLLWAKKMGANNSVSQSLGYAIHLDGSNNIYTTGYFHGSVDFDPGPGAFNLNSSSMYYSGFISKLDLNGNFLWARMIGGEATSIVRNTSISSDASGNIYAAGFFNGAVDFDPGPGISIKEGGEQNIFVCKFDGDGNFVWAKAPDYTNDQKEINLSGISADLLGNLYCVGEFKGSVDFDPGTGTNLLQSNNTTLGAFVWKLTVDGEFVWVKTTDGPWDDFGLAITTDPAGNIYFTGKYGKGSVIYPSDMFVTKMSSAGEVIWGKQTKTSPCSIEEQSGGYSIDLDANGNVYVIGSFAGLTNFEFGTGNHYLSSVGGDDIFLTKFNNDGIFLWAKQVGGSGWDLGSSLSVDNDGNIYSTGAFENTADLNPGSLLNEVSAEGESDVFISKISPCKASSATSLTINTCKTYVLNKISYENSGDYTQTISNAVGCDSVISIHLTIQREQREIFATSCSDYTLPALSYNACGLDTSYYHFDSTGDYRVTALGDDGCETLITLHLTIARTTVATVTKTICSGNMFEGYGTSGVYRDTLLNQIGCDSIRVLDLTVLPLPHPELGADTILCNQDTIRLSPGKFASYQWQNGSTQEYFIASEPGRYSVTVTGDCGQATDEIIIKEASCSINFPNAFTPNHDGLNDEFKILNPGYLTEYHMDVYNRWGGKVFQTNDYSRGWDGSANGVAAVNGVYIWTCRYRKPGTSAVVVRKGTVVLIR